MPSKSICILIKGKGMELIFERNMTFPRTDHSLFPVDHSLPAQREQHPGISGFIFEGIFVEGWETAQQDYLLPHHWCVCTSVIFDTPSLKENPRAHCNIIDVIGNFVLEHSQNSHHTQASLSNHWTFHSSLSHPPYLSLLPNSSEAPFKPYWHDCQL